MLGFACFFPESCGCGWTDLLKDVYPVGSVLCFNIQTSMSTLKCSTLTALTEGADFQTSASFPNRAKMAVVEYEM